MNSTVSIVSVGLRNVSTCRVNAHGTAASGWYSKRMVGVPPCSYGPVMLTVRPKSSTAYVVRLLLLSRAEATVPNRRSCVEVELSP
jgi:hypothetical protein